MKNETLLKKLLKIKEKSKKYDDNIELINQLITDVKNEILLENNINKNSTKARNRYCLNYAKKLRKSTRPVLSYCKYDNENQIFTDGVFFVSLSKNDYLPLEAVPENMNYPTTDHLIKNINYNINSIIINTNNLLNNLKLYSKLTIKIDENKYIALDSENLKKLLTFMNLLKEDIITINYHDFSNTLYCGYPVSVKNGDSIGLLCTFRLTEIPTEYHIIKNNELVLVEE